MVDTWTWRGQFAFYDEDLNTGYNRTLTVARREFARQVMGGYSRLKTFHALDPRLSCMFLARTNGEIPYIDELGAIPMNRLTQWRGQELFATDAYVYERPQLKA